LLETEVVQVQLRGAQAFVEALVRFPGRRKGEPVEVRVPQLAPVRAAGRRLALRQVVQQASGVLFFFTMGCS
jgi:hypothetical protein